ncbi:hypothetical protein [Actinoplanes sp. NPDC051859]|uniref:hypothetical protein n=1 Tax=Actinoplanes sp. NPDC051859 TaxID=3363909 RepID=UPI003788CC8E
MLSRLLAATQRFRKAAFPTDASSCWNVWRAGMDGTRLRESKGGIVGQPMTNTDIKEQQALAEAHDATGQRLRTVSDDLQPKGTELRTAVWGAHSPGLSAAVEQLVTDFNEAIQAFNMLGEKLKNKAVANAQLNNSNADRVREYTVRLNN